MAEKDRRSTSYRAEDMSAGRRNLLYNGFLQYKDPGDSPGMQKVSGRAEGSATESY